MRKYSPCHCRGALFLPLFPLIPDLIKINVTVISIMARAKRTSRANMRILWRHQINWLKALKCGERHRVAGRRGLFSEGRDGTPQPAGGGEEQVNLALAVCDVCWYSFNDCWCALSRPPPPVSLRLGRGPTSLLGSVHGCSADNVLPLNLILDM